MAKPAQVRFYLDADVLGLAKGLCAFRNDVTYPGFQGGDKKDGRIRQPCPIERSDTADVEWIGLAAERGWLIITRDSRIQERTAELAAVREAGARMIALVGKDAIRPWDQLRTIVKRWDRLESLLLEPGPFIYAVGKNTFRSVPLEPRAKRSGQGVVNVKARPSTKRADQGQTVAAE